MKKNKNILEGVVGAFFAGSNRELYLAMNRNVIIEDFKKMTGKYDFTPFFSFPDSPSDTIVIKLISPSVVEEYKNLYGDEYENKLNENFGWKG